jgi:hypothetical protein
MRSFTRAAGQLDDKLAPCGEGVEPAGRLQADSVQHAPPLVAGVLVEQLPADALEDALEVDRCGCHVVYDTAAGKNGPAEWWSAHGRMW